MSSFIWLCPRQNDFNYHRKENDEYPPVKIFTIGRYS